ncbi:hypothetical protein HDG34_003646 [Paraburkholderia sp. HC6.4b]|nr:hypothetical protein [Paraburkholderia sp. HC6.4b]MBB5451669.1 hypothetical protein [Paraburkholderia sp. Kb1A]
MLSIAEQIGGGVLGFVLPCVQGSDEAVNENDGRVVLHIGRPLFVIKFFEFKQMSPIVVK